MRFVGLPVARVGIMEAKEAICLHPLALQWASSSNEGARHTACRIIWPDQKLGFMIYSCELKMEIEKF